MWNENYNCCMRFGLKSNLYREILCPYTFSASLKRIGLKLRSPATVGLTHFHQFKGHNSGVPKAIWLKLKLIFILCPYTLSPIVSTCVFIFLKTQYWFYASTKIQIKVELAVSPPRPWGSSPCWRPCCSRAARGKWRRSRPSTPEVSAAAIAAPPGPLTCLEISLY